MFSRPLETEPSIQCNKLRNGHCSGSQLHRISGNSPTTCSSNIINILTNNAPGRIHAKRTANSTHSYYHAVSRAHHRRWPNVSTLSGPRQSTGVAECVEYLSLSSKDNLQLCCDISLIRSHFCFAHAYRYCSYGFSRRSPINPLDTISVFRHASPPPSEISSSDRASKSIDTFEPTDWHQFNSQVSTSLPCTSVSL